MDKIVKGDSIKIDSLDKSKISPCFNLEDFKEVRVERVNTDNPNCRALGNCKDYFQLILVYKDEVDISDILCMKGSRSQRITYKK